jgi:hypothetical protein
MTILQEGKSPTLRDYEPPGQPTRKPCLAGLGFSRLLARAIAKDHLKTRPCKKFGVAEEKKNWLFSTSPHNPNANLLRLTLKPFLSNIL